MSINNRDAEDAFGRNNESMALNILKYIVFIIFALLLLLIWKGIFILQGGIGFQDNIFLLPVKFLPIFLYTSLASWPMFKMFDHKKRISKRRNVSFIFGGVAVILSLTFQYFMISKRDEPFTFKNKMFSHLRPVKINSDFTNRMFLSSAEYAKLMPLGSLDGEIISYIANIAAEASIIYGIRELIIDNNIKNTCKKYHDYNKCIIDFQKDIYFRYHFTSTGNILLVAIGTIGIFKIKKLMSEKYGKKDIYVLTKSANDLIEISTLAAEKAKLIILTKNWPLKFSMGYEMSEGSILATVERLINYSFLATHNDKISGIISNVDKELTKLETEGTAKSKRSSAQLLDSEKERFSNLKSRYLSFQNHGFKLDEIKAKQKDMDKEMKEKLDQIKEQSFLFKVSAFFKPSLYDLTVDDLMKKQNKKKSGGIVNQ
jgi:hypothetical protein